MKVNQIQENIHRLSDEFIDIKQELKQNLRTIDEQNNQLNQLRLNRQNITISADDFLSLEQQIDNEEKSILELKEQKKQMNQQVFEQIILVNTYERERWKLNKNRQSLFDKIQLKQEEIENEMRTKRELSRMIIQLKRDLKQQQKILSINHQQVNQSQVKHQYNPTDIPTIILERKNRSRTST